MAPQPINDDAILLEVAIQLLRHPGKFAPAFKAAAERTSFECHTLESARRRVQDKYKAERNLWLARARQEIQRRQEEKIQHFQQQQKEMAKIAQATAEQFRPQIEAASLLAERMQVQMNTPQMRAAIKRAAILQAQIRKLNLPF